VLPSFRFLLPALLCVASASATTSARAVALDGFLATGSALEQGSSSVALVGTIRLELGALPPLVANTSFDVAAVDAETPALDPSIEGLSITLDDALANPGLGVLFTDGTFLIPSLHLSVDGSDLTVSNVAGTFGASAACGGALCLETSFAVDPGSGGLVNVRVVAHVPEPGTALLALATACSGFAVARRGRV